MIDRVQRLIAALPETRRREVGGLLLLMLLAALADGGAIVSLASLLEGLGNNGLPGGGTTVALFTALIVLSGVLRILLSYAAQHVGHHASRDLIVAAHRNWLDQPYAFHLQRHSAEMLATPERIDQAIFGLLLPVLQAIAAAMSAIVIVVALLFVDAAAALAMLAALLVMFAAAGFALRAYLSRKGREANQAYEQRIRAIQESHGAIRDIIVDGSQTVHGERLRGAADAVASAGVATATAGALPRHLIETGGILAAVLLAVFLSRDGGVARAVPLLGALALAGQRLMPAAQSLFQAWTGATAAGPMVDDAMALIDLPPATVRPEAPAPRFERSIELDAVSFAYPGIDAAAISDVTLYIARGERIVLTGPSGAGKSTLADVLMGLLTPTSGTIRLDGIPCSPAGLQRLASHVPQTPFFADRSLADAIAASLPANSDRIRQVVTLAGLDQTVFRLKDGLGTLLGERGIRLSGGERQRIALARAIYRGAPLLLLDEATSAVDDETEQHILDSLDRLQAEGTTIIIIAHRGGALARGGRIVRLEQGRMVAASATVAPRLEHQDGP